jgi:hypothetical protein
MSKRRHTALQAGLAVALLATGCTAGRNPVSNASPNADSSACEATASTDVPQPSAAQLEAAGLGELAVAGDEVRVDLIASAFSRSTTVTNPLFPISDLHSVLLNGTVDDLPFRTETTLLPDTRVIEWSPGQCVRTLVSQYIAYLGGRIEEVALDFYAQADDGSVWYFGEDVFNYDGGVVADLSGTWLAGKEGPAAMIMPAHPRVGNVNRPENIPGLVFEEVAVKEVDKTVDGPRGPVEGAIVGRELHDDGTFSDKVFAPGYGEFYTAHEGDVEALALAVPTDYVEGGVPEELQTMLAAADSVFDAAGSAAWLDALTALERTSSAWAAHNATSDVPPRLIEPTEWAMHELTRAVGERDQLASRQAALDTRQAVLDLQLQFTMPAEIDRARFDLWSRQVLVDAAGGDLDAVAGDVATLEWIRDRIATTFDSVVTASIDAAVEELRTAIADEDLRAVVEATTTVRELVSAVSRRYGY